MTSTGASTSRRRSPVRARACGEGSCGGLSRFVGLNIDELVTTSARTSLRNRIFPAFASSRDRPIWRERRRHRRRTMNTPKNKDVEPESELAEQDEEPTLPQPEAEEQIDLEAAAGPLAAGRAAIARFGRHAPSSPGRLPHDRRRRRRALCRQGEEHPQTRARLSAAGRARQPDRTDDRRNGGAGVRLHRHRNRSAAARSQSDQAAAAALQRAAARRQVVSLYPHHGGSLGAADPQASRRAHARGQLLRTVRLGLGGQPHRQRAAARLPAALVLGCVLRKPHPAVPALSDQALLGALHRRDRVSRLRRAGARSQCVSLRQEPRREGGARGRDGEGVGRARFRARRRLPRPAGGALRHPVAAGHQSARRRGGRRFCRPPGRRLHLHRGVLLPHRTELGQPRLFSQGRPLACARRGAGRVPRPVL